MDWQEKNIKKGKKEMQVRMFVGKNEWCSYADKPRVR